MTTRAASTTSRAHRLLRAVACGVAFAVPVALLAFVAREQVDAVIRLDESIIKHTTDITREHPAFKSVLVVWQEALQPWRLYIVATGICLWAWVVKKYRTRAWWAFVTMMVTWFLALQLKTVVHRARPVVADAVSNAPGWSFPSGHAANTAVALTCLSILVWPMAGRVGRWVVATGATTVIVLTALDRVFLGVHYPTDVTAGILVGCGFAFSSYAGYVGGNPVDATDEQEPAVLSPDQTFP